MDGTRHLTMNTTTTSASQQNRPPVSFLSAQQRRKPIQPLTSSGRESETFRMESHTSKSTSMTTKAVNQWNIPLAVLNELSPSRPFYTLKDENFLRAQTAHFISQMGQKCKITQWAIATASVYMHVFYARFSLTQFDRFEVAATCLFLAGKVEERRTRVDQVIQAYFVIRSFAKLPSDKLPMLYVADAQGRKVPKIPSSDSDEFDRMRQRMYQLEHVVLDAIEFQFEIVHPYTNLMSFLRDRIYGAEFSNESKEFIQRETSEKGGLAQMAWLFINDSLRSTLCLRYPPDVITVGIINLSISHKKYPPPTRFGLSPEAQSLAKPWYEQLFNLDKKTLDDIGMITLNSLELDYSFQMIRMPPPATTPSKPRQPPHPHVKPQTPAGQKQLVSTSVIQPSVSSVVASTNDKSSDRLGKPRLPPVVHHAPLPGQVIPGHNPQRPGQPQISHSEKRGRGPTDSHIQPQNVPHSQNGNVRDSHRHLDQQQSVPQNQQSSVRRSHSSHSSDPMSIESNKTNPKSDPKSRLPDSSSSRPRHHSSRSSNNLQTAALGSNVKSPTARGGDDSPLPSPFLRSHELVGGPESPKLAGLLTSEIYLHVSVTKNNENDDERDIMRDISKGREELHGESGPVAIDRHVSDAREDGEISDNEPEEIDDYQSMHLDTADDDRAVKRARIEEKNDQERENSDQHLQIDDDESSHEFPFENEHDQDNEMESDERGQLVYPSPTTPMDAEKVDHDMHRDESLHIPSNSPLAHELSAVHALVKKHVNDGDMQNDMNPVTNDKSVPDAIGAH